MRHFKLKNCDRAKDRTTLFKSVISHVCLLLRSDIHRNKTTQNYINMDAEIRKFLAGLRTKRGSFSG